MNLYQYCRNNPINYIDPMGLCIDAEKQQQLERWLKFNKGYVNEYLKGRISFKDLLKKAAGAVFGGDWLRKGGMAGIAAVATTLAASDGPLPIGDLVAVAVVAVAVGEAIHEFSNKSQSDSGSKPKSSGGGGEFNPKRKKDQKDDSWYYHWDKNPHEKRGGKGHWDRGNLTDGTQEWSPDGKNWYPK